MTTDSWGVSRLRSSPCDVQIYSTAVRGHVRRTQCLSNGRLFMLKRRISQRNRIQAICTSNTGESSKHAWASSSSSQGQQLDQLTQDNVMVTPDLWLASPKEILELSSTWENPLCPPSKWYSLTDSGLSHTETTSASEWPGCDRNTLTAALYCMSNGTTAQEILSHGVVQSKMAFCKNQNARNPSTDECC